MQSPIKNIIVHLIYRFDIGGLERVMVNCINAMYEGNVDEHVVIALTEIGDFSKHLNPRVKTYQLNKKSGKDLASHWRLFKLLRQIKPDVIHTYNLAAIEYHPIAKLAGVKGHIHAEHGREINDPQGLNKKHNFLRKLMAPFIHYFTPVSTDLNEWLADVVGIKRNKIELIRNGIDTNKFSRSKRSHDVFDGYSHDVPHCQSRGDLVGNPELKIMDSDLSYNRNDNRCDNRNDEEGDNSNDEQGDHQNNERCVRFIHIARFNPVKDQQSLIQAFATLVNDNKYSSKQLSLTLVGDGELTDKLTQLVSDKQLNDFVIFTGARNDIPELLSQADVFVLSSIAEGIPMTVLEAMAASLPIVSTDVGGLSELVKNGQTGMLVEKENIEVLAKAMQIYIDNPELITLQGEQAHHFVEQNCSEANMVREYLNLYNKSLGQK